jgi:hypothetical protein
MKIIINRRCHVYHFGTVEHYICRKLNYNSIKNTIVINGKKTAMKIAN